MVQEPPSDPRTSEMKIGGWEISAHEGPISDSVTTTRICEDAGVSSPTMLFGSSYLLLTRGTFTLRFDAFHALCEVLPRDPNLRVASSAQWVNREINVPLSAPPVTSNRDWTYTTTYRGTLSHTTPATDTTLTIDNAALRDHTIPIRYFASIPLFEDELDDNGAASYRVRIRCMPNFLFILARFFLRIDGVLVRVHDTRYYHRYDTDVLIRQCTRQQASYAELPPSLNGPLLRDGDKVAAELPVLSRDTSHLSLTSVSESAARS